MGKAPSVGRALNENTGVRCGLLGLSQAQLASLMLQTRIQLSGGGWCILLQNRQRDVHIGQETSKQCHGSTEYLNVDPGLCR